MNSSSRSQLTKKARSVLWDLRILVVDDEEFSRTLMQDNLTRLCEHVDAAGNGEQAYELYQQHYYDLIITDLEMPVKNGFWLIEKIRQDCFFKPILVITAFSDDKHSRQCLDLGVTGFIPKPVDLSLLYINLYRFGSGLHEKKVMFQYQQELERYTKTCHVRMEQLKILQSGLEGVLTPEIKKAILERFHNENVIPLHFLLEKTEKKPQKVVKETVQESQPVRDTFAYDQFKTEDLQKFYETEEDIRDFLSQMFIHPEVAHEVFHHIAPQILLISESLAKYPHYAALSDKLKQLGTALENVKQEQDLKRFNYLFESFMDTLGHWCHVVLGGNDEESQDQKTDIYSVMHDVDILCNALTADDSDDTGELELF